MTLLPLAKTLKSFLILLVVCHAKASKFDTSAYLAQLFGIPSFDIGIFVGKDGKINVDLFLHAVSPYLPPGFLPVNNGTCYEQPYEYPGTNEELARHLNEPSLCTIVVGSGYSIDVRKDPLPYYCNVVSTRQLVKEDLVVRDDGSGPFVWADAGTTFGELADALAAQGFETIDEPGFADITVGAAVVVKAHGDHHKSMFVDTVRSVEILKEAEIIELRTPEEISALSASSNAVVLRVKLHVQERRYYRMEYAKYPIGDWQEVIDDIGDSVATEWFLEDGSIHTYQKYEASPDDGFFETDHLANFAGWVTSQLGGREAYGNFMNQFIIPKNNGWIWPTGTYFDALHTLPTFNSEFMLNYHLLPAEKLTEYIEKYPLARLEFRRQQDILWIDVVADSKIDFAQFFEVFSGLPFYLHEGKVIPPSVQYLRFDQVDTGSSTNEHFMLRAENWPKKMWM